MNRIRTWWLHRRHQEAYAMWDGIRRDEQRRRRERADSTGDVRPAAERVQQAVDLIREQAVRPVPVASDANALQEYLEGDSRQQDAAALRMDRRALLYGQMTLARFRELHPDLIWPDLPSLCLHPDAVTVTGPLRGVTEVSCPVCPARAYAQWPAVPTLPPWLIPTTGETPPDCNGGA